MSFVQLGPYRVGKKIGRGGMGTVFEAVHSETGHPAAVKLLNPHLADEEGFRERFEVEIETLKKLKHPNIVRLYGFGEQDGHLYYAMELVRGRNLEDELQSGRRFDWRETTHIAIKICRALKHAHDHGVIHRDLKPANLLLATDGEMKLTDFGIARLFGNTRMTVDGGLVGTAEYMAPEQAEGKQVTYHADLYALGSVMYAMLTGGPPFRSRSLPEMLQMQRYAEPPLVSKLAPDVPKELERIIAKLLSKTPQDRVANADLLARQLAAMEHGLSVPPRRPGETPPPLLESGAFNSARTVSEPAVIYDPNAPTKIAADEPFTPVPAKASSAVPLLSDLPTNVTAAYDPAKFQSTDIELTVSAPPVAVAKPPSRFTTLEEDERRRRTEGQRQQRGQFIAQIAALVLALAGIAALAWYFTRPEAADPLYERIELLATDEQPDKLLQTEADIQDFLTRFPDDPRGKHLRAYQEEIELLKLERQFSRRSRQLTRDESLTPLERDYIEAMNYIGTDPQRTISELQAIVGLYGGAAATEPIDTEPIEIAPSKVTSTDVSDADRAARQSAQILLLAKRQLARLEKQVTQQAPAYLEVIDRAMKQAEQLRTSDIQQSRQIWQSIITLYGDKPWAASRVAKAKAFLEQTKGPAE
ncbi:MAG: serine/threonine-protein kinase [Planctomycetota bacterium]|nr:serine/threonine-protein kinase [Planctomycetota bacterium]